MRLKYCPTCLSIYQPSACYCTQHDRRLGFCLQEGDDPCQRGFLADVYGDTYTVRRVLRDAGMQPDALSQLLGQDETE